MTGPRLMLDTDIFSAIMRKHPLATAQARSYLAAHGRLTFSIITRYEIMRGLKAKQASRQVAAFDKLCSSSEVLPITDEVIMRATDIYVDLYRRGELVGDAAILIAASALVNGYGVVTNNESHFWRVRGLAVESWLK